MEVSFAMGSIDAWTHFGMAVRSRNAHRDELDRIVSLSRGRPLCQTFSVVARTTGWANNRSVSGDCVDASRMSRSSAVPIQYDDHGK